MDEQTIVFIAIGVALVVFLIIYEIMKKKKNK
jgi:hypothetical protein